MANSNLDKYSPSLEAEARAPSPDAVNKLLGRLAVLPYKDRKDRNLERVDGTCGWFTSHSKFRIWQRNSASGLLWVSADPGCGKSVLAKYLVDEVLRSTDANPNIVCYFFFKEDFDDQRTLENALCCILHQIFKQQPTRFSLDLIHEFVQGGETIFTSFSSLWDILVRVASSHNTGKITCVLDALDECEESGRKRLATALTELYRGKATSGLNFLVTSRPYDRIRQGFALLEERYIIHLSGDDQAEVDKIFARD